MPDRNPSPPVDDRFVVDAYHQLRGAARLAMRHERAHHTLQPTALVHEAFARLFRARRTPFESKAHVYAAAAEMMRQVLIDHARARRRLKRGGNHRTEPLKDLPSLAAQDSEKIMMFNDVFERLEKADPPAAEVVRLRFFAGLSVDETADLLKVSPSTIDRRWAYARAWLYDRLK